jgi:hypothetical protein
MYIKLKVYCLSIMDNRAIFQVRYYQRIVFVYEANKKRALPTKLNRQYSPMLNGCIRPVGLVT